MAITCDPYESTDQKCQLTRRILAVLADFHNTISISTKETLVTRDLDILQELAHWAHCSVSFGVGSLDEKAWRLTEPQTPHPKKRLQTMEKLAKAGIPNGVLLALSIPHLRSGSREWFVPLVREAYPHLDPLYAHLYRGPYTPEEYTQHILSLVDDLRQRYEFAPRPQTHVMPAGGLQIALGI